GPDAGDRAPDSGGGHDAVLCGCARLGAGITELLVSYSRLNRHDFGRGFNGRFPTLRAATVASYATNEVSCITRRRTTRLGQGAGACGRTTHTRGLCFLFG